MISLNNISTNITFEQSLCTVILKSIEKPVQHNLRNQRLIENYIRGDAILYKKLLNGDCLKKTFNINDHTNEDKIIQLIKPLVLPRHVDDFLYPYQRFGVSWLIKKKRGILADDMGLGKTYQAISAARRLVRSGRIDWGLIVTPKSLLNTWFDEFNKWSPELKVNIVSRSEINSGFSWAKLINSSHIVLTTYETLRANTQEILKNSPDLIIADEAHRLRKKESLVFQSFKTLKTNYLWLLSGTPIERASEDLVVLLSIIEPRQFSYNDKSIHRISLQARARSYFLRRTKSEVLSQLPPVIETLESLEFTDAQRNSYNQTLRSNIYSSHLARFSKLREICDYDEDSGESVKIDRILEIVADIKLSNEKVIIFSYILMPLNILAKKLRSESINFEMISGEQSIEVRKNVIESFKNDQSVVVLLASTKAASEGITLTEANNVIFINKWWNPSSNIQARDRVSRIGQTKLVNVVSFKIKHSLEDNLEKILENKQTTFDQIMGSLSVSGLESIA